MPREDIIAAHAILGNYDYQVSHIKKHCWVEMTKNYEQENKEHYYQKID